MKTEQIVKRLKDIRKELCLPGSEVFYQVNRLIEDLESGKRELPEKLNHSYWDYSSLSTLDQAVLDKINEIIYYLKERDK